MCKYVIVITVIARQDVDGYFGTTLNLGCLDSVEWNGGLEWNGGMERYFGNFNW